MAKESLEFKDLTKVHFPQHFTELTKLHRSRPLFKTKVFVPENITGKEKVFGSENITGKEKVFGSENITGKEKVFGSENITGKETDFVHLGCLMESRNGIQEKTILTKLRYFTSGKDTTVWIFNNLAVNFGLPVSECLPDCVVAQVFVLGKRNKPPFILTLKQDNTKHEFENLPCRKRSAVIDEFPLKRTSPDTATNSKPQDKILATETETKVRSFTVKVAKELLTLLSNFCSCEFVILPCILSYEDFLNNQSSLDDEITEQLRHTHSFYNGPDVLDSNTYNALSQAVRVVQGMSSIPWQLKDPEKEDDLVVLDHAWQEVMQQAIVDLMTSCKPWHCTKENEFKVIVAVLEAARRISFSCKMEVKTSDENVMQCLNYVKELTKKDTGISLNLEAVCAENDCEYKFFEMKRGIHLVCDDAREGKSFFLICTVKSATDETYQNKHEQTKFGAMEVDRRQSENIKGLKRKLIAHIPTKVVQQKETPNVLNMDIQYLVPRKMTVGCLAGHRKPLGVKFKQEGKLPSKELRDSIQKPKVDGLKTQPKRKAKTETCRRKQMRSSRLRQRPHIISTY